MTKITIEELERDFDKKYGYEYPRCALIMRNIEVRDENEELIGHTDSAAVTPQEIKSFFRSSLQRAFEAVRPEKKPQREAYRESEETKGDLIAETFNSAIAELDANITTFMNKHDWAI